MPGACTLAGRDRYREKLLVTKRRCDADDFFMNRELKSRIIPTVDVHELGGERESEPRNNARISCHPRGLLGSDEPPRWLIGERSSEHGERGNDLVGVVGCPRHFDHDLGVVSGAL